LGGGLASSGVRPATLVPESTGVGPRLGPGTLGPVFTGSVPCASSLGSKSLGGASAVEPGPCTLGSASSGVGLSYASFGSRSLGKSAAGVRLGYARLWPSSPGGTRPGTGIPWDFYVDRTGPGTSF